MGMHERADREAEFLEQGLASGDITETEYNRYMKELGEEMRQYEQGEYQCHKN